MTVTKRPPFSYAKVLERTSETFYGGQWVWAWHAGMACWKKGTVSNIADGAARVLLLDGGAVDCDWGTDNLWPRTD